MKTILLVPLRDYYQSRKRIWVKYLIPVVLGLLALAGALIFNIGNEETIRSTFSEFVNVQINVVAILVSFSVAIISILVSSISISRLFAFGSSALMTSFRILISFFIMLKINYLIDSFLLYVDI